VVAIVLSVASLTWQIVSWRRSGSVVTVRVAQFFPVYDQGLGDLYTSVTAHNSGRAPVTVTGWGLRLPSGGTIVMTRNLPWFSPLPYRLEAGAEGSWAISTDDVRASCAEHNVRYQDLRPFVKLGDGQTVTAKRRGIGLR
jgi:hypothetical protein